ncbi:MAG: hypothetical protein ACXWZ1_12610 [Gaiellaceae bacterium]
MRVLVETADRRPPPEVQRMVGGPIALARRGLDGGCVRAPGDGEMMLWVLPSTSPANAAMPWDERLRWFPAFRESL